MIIPSKVFVEGVREIILKQNSKSVIPTQMSNHDSALRETSKGVWRAGQERGGIQARCSLSLESLDCSSLS